MESTGLWRRLDPPYDQSKHLKLANPYPCGPYDCTCKFHTIRLNLTKDFGNIEALKSVPPSNQVDTLFSHIVGDEETFQTPTPSLLPCFQVGPTSEAILENDYINYIYNHQPTFKTP